MKRTLAIVLALALMLPQGLFGQSIVNGSRVLVGTQNYCADAGGSDSYACNLSPAITTYTTGATYYFKANTANTGAASIALNGLAALTIRKWSAGSLIDLITTDIGAGQQIAFIYDGTYAVAISLGGGGSAVYAPVWSDVGATGGGSTLTFAGTANHTYCIGLPLMENVAVTTMHFYAVQDLAGGDLYDLGIYDSGGNLKLHIGATAMSSTGYKDIAILGGGTVNLLAGKYYLCTTGNAITALINYSSTSYMNYLVRQTDVAATTSGGALNSTMTPPADSWILTTPITLGLN